MFGAPFQFGFATPQPVPQQRATRYAQPRQRTAAIRSTALDGTIAQQASANGVPLSLVHRVIKRESGYNPRAVSRGNYGLMQIRLGTARAMGYGGSAAGLLDANTNMTYAVRYLAGAYRAAGGNESRAVALYARGYRTARVQTRTRAYSSPRYGFSAAPRAAAPVSVAFLTNGWGGSNPTVYRTRHHHRRHS
jgi:soluble lytic murein transglycosylase-like protein